MSQRSLPKRLWYNFLHAICRLLAVVLFRIRVSGREHVPREGGLLICSNHQSHLDPILIGLSLDRRMNFLARRSLFKFALFRWLILSLDAIPIERDGFGIAGIKETLRRLKRGEAVLIFPEGTRTRDGAVQPLKPGFVALARRGKVPILPLAVAGAYEAWPRWRPFPRRADIQLCVGEPISNHSISEWNDEQVLAELEQRIRQCHQQAQAARRSNRLA